MEINKTFTFTPAQYHAAEFSHRVLGRILAQASPTDETPLALSVFELLQLAGEELMGNLVESQAKSQAKPAK